jgi:hypothetical protein
MRSTQYQRENGTTAAMEGFSVTAMADPRVTATEVSYVTTMGSSLGDVDGILQADGDA